ncbi:alpha-1,3-glucanase [Lasiosphaeria miniovina]|uniref:Alpha-1,3-glucanase n=1 Tax=Lasiosphaeria miniovina TaxID=1954250 RepID=A0AA40A4P6_9PEZI|nr:alpha-1,3-glucanase [Lasiosphaeria miniovina]KAK0709214.1 alpha-1,3-glucanase [Lasiosphaeria miniovina]
MDSILRLARLVGALCLLVGLFTRAVYAAPLAAPVVAPRASSNGPLVFAHFIVGTVANRQTAGDWDVDMQSAKAAGIDAFALNIGLDSYNTKQLDIAYQSAANNGLKVFISFDFNYWSTGNPSAIGQMIARYASNSGQLIVDNKVFVSSFLGDGLNVGAVRSAAGVPIFFAPNFNPYKTGSSDGLDAAFNWMAWNSNGRNKAPSPGALMTVQDGDNAYKNWLGSKPYVSPISPWFHTHYGPEVSYSKNWLFPSDTLWYDRWNTLLQSKPRFIEIVTWNDWGESSYLSPLSASHHDDGNSKWANDMPHEAWLDMAKPFISAYHAGASKPDSYIKEDQIVYWFRQNPKGLNCDGTDTTMGPANNASGDYFNGRPNGADGVEDSIIVVSLLTAAGTVSVTSGNKATVTYNAPAGAYLQKIPMGVGSQSFELTRGGKSIIAGTSPKEVSGSCICGIYNFNAFVGKIPDQGFGTLNAVGAASLTQGLRVATCQPQATLNGQPAAGAPPRQTQAPANPSPSAAGPSPTSTAALPIPTPTTSIAIVKPNAASGCNGGTVAAGLSGNFIGLCQFSCALGYCPAGVCVCTSNGSPSWNAVVSQPGGCPKPGMSDGYAGLCSFTCARGYCPDSACQPNC